MVKNWFCRHLFHGLLKFQEYIGVIAWARFDIEEKCAQFERQNRGIPMIPRQLKPCDIINSGRFRKPVITDSISQALEMLRDLDITSTSENNKIVSREKGVNLDL